LCHLSWHLALFELASGHEARALELYEQAISPAVGQTPTTLVDAASLLWRYQIYGCEPRPLPWAEVCGYAAPVTARRGIALAVSRRRRRRSGRGSARGAVWLERATESGRAAGPRPPG